ncbi:MAG: glycine cleavage system protein H [Promethearchaeota archaeon]|jgi:glycine cleavage system H protein
MANLFTKTHQWYNTDTKKVGLSAYAAEQLGEISFVDLEGLADAELTQVEMSGDEPTSDPIDATVESSKAVGDVYSPVSGAVKEINEALMDEPEKINEDPLGAGWLYVIEPSNLDAEKGNLLSEDDYKAFTASL